MEHSITASDTSPKDVSSWISAKVTHSIEEGLKHAIPILRNGVNDAAPGCGIKYLQERIIEIRLLLVIDAVIRPQKLCKFRLLLLCCLRLGFIMVNTRLYVGGISNEITREHLQDLFGNYGKSEHVWVPTNPPGFAFVNFETEADASNACDALNGEEFMGCKLHVEVTSSGTR
ncbi:RNA-binding protein Rsf1 [Orchesella cincta]|uniref:RNA-binding protein Rsf1 n=1 Tax=Orchesella cincta TaxID=48709 RepID=A0A1D2N7V4_ORCCI|nr:RNA-binding protein Rsf1 [Orchesella cincta]